MKEISSTESQTFKIAWLRCLSAFFLPFVIFGFIHGLNISEDLRTYSGNPTIEQESTTFWQGFFEFGLVCGLVGLAIERSVTFIIKRKVH